LVTLANLLDDHPSNKDSIIIPGTEAITYGEFSDEIERIAGLLAGNGLEREKAVSIVLGNGCEFMVTFLAVARAGAIAAPLNSAYTVEEFKFFMEDANAQLVIVSEDSDAAIQAAGDLEIPVATISGNRIAASESSLTITNCAFASSMKNLNSSTV
jgi:acyl-CoA synthetase (AMP-forming)/AMP-acid ligase II